MENPVINYYALTCIGDFFSLEFSYYENGFFSEVLTLLEKNSIENRSFSTAGDKIFNLVFRYTLFVVASTKEDEISWPCKNSKMT
jgi:hypothetical protein